VFVLNCALEHPLLVEVLASWSASDDGAAGAVNDVPRLARATENLVGDGLVAVYEDDLVGEELTLLPQDRAARVVADPLNWWRDEDDATVSAATSVFVLDIPEPDQTAHEPRRRWLGRRA
jgi:hypothetical protein